MSQRLTPEQANKRREAERVAWGTYRRPFEADGQYLSRVADGYRDVLRLIAAGEMSRGDAQALARKTLSDLDNAKP